jgi:mannose-6-phosphate isomerase-like protein (cupin superfamily)
MAGGNAMATKIETPETKGHDESALDSGEGVMERAIKKLRASTDPTQPQLFEMKIGLPKEGRTAALLGATDHMWVNLKAYAEGGENTLHAHTNEDHTFIILAGRATFHGPEGKIATLGRNQGMLLPRGAHYHFHAEKGEPLVILRMGCIIDPGRDAWERVGIDGKPLPGNSKENKSAPTVFYDDRVYE